MKIASALTKPGFGLERTRQNDYGHVTMSTNTVSKSRFKAHALALFRQVERTGKPLVITDRGVPVLTVAPYRQDPQAGMRLLRESVVKYHAPTQPVADDEWESDQ